MGVQKFWTILNRHLTLDAWSGDHYGPEREGPIQSTKNPNNFPKTSKSFDFMNIFELLNIS